jgi:hypothetical protein
MSRHFIPKKQLALRFEEEKPSPIPEEKESALVQALIALLLEAAAKTEESHQDGGDRDE